MARVRSRLKHRDRVSARGYGRAWPDSGADIANGRQCRHARSVVAAYPTRASRGAPIDASPNTHAVRARSRIETSVSDAAQASEAFATKLGECVRIHLRSDVPVGCALSGGLDSSAIAVLVDSQGGGATDLHTFTCTFPGDPTDEREYVEAVLDRIRAAPHFVTPSAQGFLDDLDDFVWHHEEPAGGLWMYAGYCVARATRAANVPVTLNGQGGDEILSGYWQSYFMYLRELGFHGRVLTLATHLAGALLPDGNPSLLEQVPVMLRRYLARRRGLGSVAGQPTVVLPMALSLARIIQYGRS